MLCPLPQGLLFSTQSILEEQSSDHLGLPARFDAYGSIIPGATHKLITTIHGTALAQRYKDARATRTRDPGDIIPLATSLTYHDSLAIRLRGLSQRQMQKVCSPYTELVPTDSSHEYYEIHMADKLRILAGQGGFTELSENQNEKFRKVVMPFMLAVYGLSLSQPIFHPNSSR